MANVYDFRAIARFEPTEDMENVKAAVAAAL